MHENQRHSAEILGLPVRCRARKHVVELEFPHEGRAAVKDAFFNSLPSVSGFIRFPAVRWLAPLPGAAIAGRPRVHEHGRDLRASLTATPVLFTTFPRGAVLASGHPSLHSTRGCQ
jgi:hypothetical protein